MTSEWWVTWTATGAIALTAASLSALWVMWGELAQERDNARWRKACADRMKDERDAERTRRKAAEYDTDLMRAALNCVLNDYVKLVKELKSFPSPPPGWSKRERRLLKVLEAYKRGIWR
ncbi:MAG: hypothetical protein SOZ52_08510 [Pyramidobacter sp.]|nr:hypothetical protein [Pyramidobacter sp.]